MKLWIEGALVPALHARSRFGDNGMLGMFPDNSWTTHFFFSLSGNDWSVVGCCNSNYWFSGDQFCGSCNQPRSTKPTCVFFLTRVFFSFCWLFLEIIQGIFTLILKVEIQLKLQIIQDFLVLYQHLTNASNFCVIDKEEQTLHALLQREDSHGLIPTNLGSESTDQSTERRKARSKSPQVAKSSMSDEEESMVTSSGSTSGWRSFFTGGPLNLSQSLTLPSLDSKPTVTTPSLDSSATIVVTPASPSESAAESTSSRMDRKGSTPASRRTSRTSSTIEEDRQRTLFFEGIVEIDGWQKFLLDVLAQVWFFFLPPKTGRCGVLFFCAGDYVRLRF